LHFLNYYRELAIQGIDAVDFFQVFVGVARGAIFSAEVIDGID
jgi:hypothetical protein